MHTKEQLMEMHSEHNEWQNKIKFYREELKKLNSQLDETIMRGPSVEQLPLIEHFQNQLTVQSEVLDVMRHDFKQHENAIEAKQESINEFDSLLGGNHESSRERLAQFEKLFRELREEFHGFTQPGFVKQL